MSAVIGSSAAGAIVGETTMMSRIHGYHLLKGHESPVIVYELSNNKLQTSNTPDKLAGFSLNRGFTPLSTHQLSNSLSQTLSTSSPSQLSQHGRSRLCHRHWRCIRHWSSLC